MVSLQFFRERRPTKHHRHLPRATTTPTDSLFAVAFLFGWSAVVSPVHAGIFSNPRKLQQNDPIVKPIEVNEDERYQEFHGCGGSWTDSSAWLMYGDRSHNFSPTNPRALTEVERTRIYEDLFGHENGIQLRILRQPMGTSDFRWADYSYQKTRDDVFSIDRDDAYIVPAMERSFIENPSIKVIGLPWSAPAWLKQNGRHDAGSSFAASKTTGDDNYEAYAAYFAKFVMAYEQRGIPVWALSMQNEPLHEAWNYPTMTMTPVEQANLLSAVATALDDKGLSNVKLVAYDHNWDRPDYPIAVLQEGNRLQSESGQATFPDVAIAFHCYGGDVASQTLVHDTYPDTEIMFTECTESGPLTSFNGDFRWALGNLVIGATRNWASTVLAWNLILDEGGPKRDGGCSNCRGLLDIVDWTTSPVTYAKRPAYYALGHLSKFTKLGARRVASTQPDATTKTVGFVNPDGSALLIILNEAGSTVEFNVSWRGMACPVRVPAWSAVTAVRTADSLPTVLQVWGTYDDESLLLSRASDVTCTPVPTASPTQAPSQHVIPTTQPTPVSVSPSTLGPSESTTPPTTPPSTESPSQADPTSRSPTTSSPTATAMFETLPPASLAPVTSTPNSESPETVQPLTSTPATTPPSNIPPITVSPVSKAETVQPTTFTSATTPPTITPIAVSPVSKVPISTSPTTASPNTAAPISAAPVTGSPSSRAPMSENPVTTAPIPFSPLTTIPLVPTPSLLMDYLTCSADENNDFESCASNLLEDPKRRRQVISRDN